MERKQDVEEAPAAKPQEESKWSRFEVTTRTGKKLPHKVLLDNWQSGLTVAMVSVPLSISLGIASVSGDDPAAPTMGVATAFWGGIIFGIFGSSDLNIIGPAGALSGMLNSYTIQFNGSGVLPYLSLISAAWIFLIWVLNLQRYLLLMPKAVFEGFTFAVAIIIGFNQLNMALDLHPAGPKHEHFYENVIESFKVLDQASAFPSIFFVVCCGLLLTLAKYLPKVKGYAIPWTVLIPLLTIIIGYLADSDNLGGLSLPTLKNKYGVLEARIVELPQQPLSYYAQGKTGGIITASFGVAFVAVLETLISAKIAEQKMDWSFDDSRESLSLVLTHAVCGVVGALPPTGVFVRTSMNMQLGATHRTSQAVNAIAVFVIAVVAMPGFSYLPQASVAALLVYASVRMAPIHYIIELFRHDKGSCALLILTTLVCVFLDPVYGLVVGMIVALLRDAAETAAGDSRLTMAGRMHLRDLKEAGGDGHPGLQEDTDINADGGTEWDRMVSQDFDKDAGLKVQASPIEKAVVAVRRRSFRRGDADADAETKADVADSVVIYEPIGPVVYLAADKHSIRLQAIMKQKPAMLVLSLELATRVDIDGSDALAKGVKQLRAAGVLVSVVLPERLGRGVLGTAVWVRELREEGFVHEHRADALRSGSKGAEELQACAAV
mmetsp:Transcript_66617/g.189101  ORF Transcript_66617/g.189101 Transcript_66617/m.189101 type:complete len:663 (-) Transcript_66617:30-2018(-)